MNTTALVPITRDNLPDAMGVLAAAFRNYPSTDYILGAIQQHRKDRKLRRLYHALADTCRVHGKATGAMVDDSLAAVSLVYPPGTLPSTLEVVAGNFLDALLIGPRHTWRFRQLDSHLRVCHQKWEVRDRYWYLLLLGVTPDRQGRGLGGTLLTKLADESDRSGQPCYLETETSQNVAIYRKFGYEVIAESVVASLGNLKIWHLRRPPSARGR